MFVQVKVAVEILFLIHISVAFPILMNAPTQLFEKILNIPLGEFFKYQPSC